MEAQQRDLETARQAKSQKHQAEIKKLKLELAKAHKTSSELKTALEDEKRLRGGEQKELQEANERADSVEKQLDQLKTKPVEWLSDLQGSTESSPVSFFTSLACRVLVAMFPN